MIKQTLFIFLGLAMLALPASAQKFGYVDSEYVLEQMPEYEAVQQEIEQLSKQWQKEIEEKYEAIDKKYQEYQAKEVLLSKEDKQRMQEEIFEMEKEAKELQRSKFGVDGELFQLREEKMRPIQEKMMKSVEKVAKDNRLNMIFDKSSSMVLLYYEARYDYSDQVLKGMGLSPGKRDEEKED